MAMSIVVKNIESNSPEKHLIEQSQKTWNRTVQKNMESNRPAPVISLGVGIART